MSIKWQRRLQITCKKKSFHITVKYTQGLKCSQWSIRLQSSRIKSYSWHAVSIALEEICCITAQKTTVQKRVQRELTHPSYLSSVTPHAAPAAHTSLLPELCNTTCFTCSSHIPLTWLRYVACSTCSGTGPCLIFFAGGFLTSSIISALRFCGCWFST